MSLIEKYNPTVLSAAHGSQPIGAAQRTISFTVVAASPTAGYIRFTATAHALKKGQTFYINGGSYGGYYRVKKVISVNVIEVAGTFGVTTTGTLLLTAAIDGFGFYADTVPVTIDELVVDNSSVDVAAFIARTFVAGQYYHIPFKKLRISAGNVTVVRKPIPAVLPYTNR